MVPRFTLACLMFFALMTVCSSLSFADQKLDLPKREGVKPRNVIFILSDDHRYDAMGFMGHPWLKTPNMDRIAKEGCHFEAGYVTTALCSPSRASILTGQYAHKHKVVDNNNPVQKGTIFFPQYLQQAGYKTGFFGKWHMGGGDDNPRPGFDKWVSFRGQGHYYPHKSGLNVDGKKVPQKGYITDEMTDYCLDWLSTIPKEQPYFMYLSHKAVHADFSPAKRHEGVYADEKFPAPVTLNDSEENYKNKPRWVQDQRNSWHGVDFAYHSRLDVREYYQRYCEALLAVDESIGRVFDALKQRGELESTMIIYMGDNGFCFGEHGLIDKRTAYEASMRVPFLARCPDLFKGGQVSQKVVANIDVGPTILHAAGLNTPDHMDGQSFLGVLQGTQKKWRENLLYEYYWEYNFPQTPTVFALRTPKYKFITYFGVWDTEELYDMENDPHEQHNLIFDSQYKQMIKKLRADLYAEMERTGGMYIPLNPRRGDGQRLRSPEGKKPADFPAQFYKSK